MIEEQEMITIDKCDLVERVAALRSSGYRLVQICSTTLSDCYEMNYSFDKEGQFKNLRFVIPPGETVPSISLIYFSAFLYENEIHDLFGITIEHMVADYHGTLYRVRIPAPFGLQPKTSGDETNTGAADKGTDKEGHDG